jgi:hypothetical protein
VPGKPTTGGRLVGAISLKGVDVAGPEPPLDGVDVGGGRGVLVAAAGNDVLVAAGDNGVLVAAAGRGVLVEAAIMTGVEVAVSAGVGVSVDAS